MTEKTAENRRDMRGVLCTERRRESAAAMTAEEWARRGFGNPEAVSDPDWLERELGAFRAQEFAGIWDDNALGVAAVNGVREFLERNEVGDLWETMSWEQRGVVYAALAYGYLMGLGRLPEVTGDER